ncbi:MAG: hypothetical protein JO086_05960 [Acidimicrobiia bacterium]|nr:hypothetical protein [Acidimicrobiia bacterium]
MTRFASRTPLTVLRVLLTVGIAESFVHYLDNTLRYSDYTGPNPPAATSWIAQWMIPVSWLLFTVAAVVGYRRFRDGRWSDAAAYLAVYSVSGLISIGHYVGISISDLSVFQNTFVFLDIALGVAVLGFATWTWRHSRDGVANAAPRAVG